MFSQLIANGIILGCSYAIAALGFALVYNTTRVFHFAHGAIYIAGAYFFHTAHNIWQLSLPSSIGMCFGFVAILGILVDEIVYAPLAKREAPELVSMLSSIGLYIVIVNAIVLLYGSATVLLIAGTQPTITIGNVVLTRIQLITAICSIVVFGLSTAFLRLTVLGKLIRAVRDDPVLVSAIGVSPRTVRWTVFALGSVLAATSAILLGSDLGLDPNLGMQALLSSAVAVIVGGIGVFEGVALGAMLLGLLQAIAIWKFEAKWQYLSAFVLLMLFLLFRPQGILGRKRRAEETLL